jgi:hypothetical protein
LFHISAGDLRLLAEVKRERKTIKKGGKVNPFMKSAAVFNTLLLLLLYVIV